MKSINIILIVILFNYAVSPAQINNNSQKLNFTGKLIAGLNGSQIDGDKLSGYNKPGILAGGALKIGFNRKFSLQPEILYSQRGSQTDDKEQQSLGRIVWNVQYISMPFIANYEIIDNLMLKGGLITNVLIRSSIKRGSDPIPNTEDFRTIDASTFFGIGYKFAPEWAISIKHSYSLFPINKIALTSDNQYNYANGNAYHNVLSFYLTYILNPER